MYVRHISLTWNRVVHEGIHVTQRFDFLLAEAGNLNFPIGLVGDSRMVFVESLDFVNRHERGV